MSDFNKDDYLNDLPDADELANGQASPDADGADAPSDTGEQLKDDMLKDAAAEQSAGEQASEESAKAAAEATADAASDGDAEGSSLTPLGQAKKEAAEYLEALQRERAEFINYRNRTKKDMDRARQQGIIDVLTAMLPGSTTSTAFASMVRWTIPSRPWPRRSTRPSRSSALRSSA